MEGMVELPGGGYDLRLFKDMTVQQKRKFEKSKTLGRSSIDIEQSAEHVGVERPIDIEMLDD